MRSGLEPARVRQRSTPREQTEFLAKLNGNFRGSMKNGIVMGFGDGLWGRWGHSYQIDTYTYTILY